ncbi:hypothetical protein IWQ60_000720 [Tieghemiomyces parasiticus]|uniref:Protein arginine N-methyltransferase n=2 Tax=Tieghemiomyces parasiticus TaxID=78921 RepID=A0A9W8ALU9_9FUNG|nr:hypothetical protein IWQ60_000720 [Tieghemiomyces parasiticus]
MPDPHTITLGVSPLILDRELAIKLDQCDESGHDFIVVPISNDRFRRKMTGALADLTDYEDRYRAVTAPFDMADLYIRTAESGERVVGLTADWIRPDSIDPAERYLAERVFEKELSWAAHIGISAIILPDLTQLTTPAPSQGAPDSSSTPQSFINYARLICRALHDYPFLQIWVRVPLSGSDPAHRRATQRIFSSFGGSIDTSSQPSAPPSAFAAQTSPVAHTESRVGDDDDDAWKHWTVLKQMCEHSPRLQVALVVNEDLPEQDRINRWFAEPLKCVIVPTSTFIVNAKGYPVLTKAHQNLVRRLHHFTNYFIVEEAGPVTSTMLDDTDSTCDTGNHQKFLRYLVAPAAASAAIGAPVTTADGISAAEADGSTAALEKFTASYKDYLQSPLQPLMDHLESATYATFEQDPIKYQQYERAIYQALLDRHPAANQTNEDQAAIIFVVGAGRGPLVDRSLAAAERAGRRVKVYALEKNPNAFVTLQRRKAHSWKERVTIVYGDMRYWAPTTPAERADILVSELLGSFGDNELSPECLDGAQQRLLKPDGISIPQSYASYLAPLSSSKLYSQVAALNGPAHFQTPFVVLFDAVDCLYPAQKVWEFVHPSPVLTSATTTTTGKETGDSGCSSSSNNNNRTAGNPAAAATTCETGDLTLPVRTDNQHNTRYAVNSFRNGKATLIHGLAGYFDSVLYGDVTLSIRPDTHTPGMFSWFPIFFPLKVPILVPEGATVTTHLWRLTSAAKVWYEWSVTVQSAVPASQVEVPEDEALTAVGPSATVHCRQPVTTVSSSIHNLNGSAYWIGL